MLIAGGYHHNIFAELVDNRTCQLIADPQPHIVFITAIHTKDFRLLDDNILLPELVLALTLF